MRFQVEIRPEDEETLRLSARDRGYPAVRYAASALLHLKLLEEAARLGVSTDAVTVAA
jgi:hypothetical protein